jgi:hypothetical protein
MQALRTTKAPTRATARSQISNRSRLLLNVDGRSSYARRFRDLVNAFSAEIGGGSLTEFEQGLVKQAALLVLKTEQMQECVVRGQEVDELHAADLETEMLKRGMMFEVIDWSEDQG